MKADLRSEIKMASGLGVAGVCALMTLQLLLVAIVFALFEGEVMPGWAAALVVAAVVLAIGTAAGLWGWAKRDEAARHDPTLAAGERAMGEGADRMKDVIPSGSRGCRARSTRSAATSAISSGSWTGAGTRLFDLQLQARRHPVAVAVAAGVAALVVGGSSRSRCDRAPAAGRAGAHAR